MYSAPESDTNDNDFSLELFFIFERPLYKVSMIKDDLPPPDTPVTLINLFKGNLIFISFKLFPLAPLSSIKLLLSLKLCFSTFMFKSFDKY